MDDMTAVLVFGVAALLLLAGVQAVRFWKDKNAGFTSSFTKSFGLILVATLGVSLALSETSVKDANGAYALLGIIAGYLVATATPDEATKKTPPSTSTKKK
jgi:hypothetical protein